MKKTRRNISLPEEVNRAAEMLSKKHGVNISFECEQRIRGLAKQFKVKVK